MRKAIPVLGALALSACTAGAPASFTEVNGFRVKVEPVAAATFRAQGAAPRDRARLDAAYYARNVIGIRNVAGCPVRPDTISHEAAGPVTTAGVICP